MNTYENICSLIGNTPLIRLPNYCKSENIETDLYAKVEYFNPAGSIKDRVAFEMIKDAEEKGKLSPGSTIIEPTSGNTGIGLAFVAAALGYKAIIVMPENMSEERKKLTKAFGAELVLTDASLGMSGCVKKANELNLELPGSIIAGQFSNPANPAAHYKTTGPEIYRDTDGKVDVLIAGIGTGGTISGTGKYLKEKNPEIKIIGFEPASSPLLTQGSSGPHKIQGIGANFIPDTLNMDVIDEILTVTDEDAYAAAKLLTKTEGIFAGISSAAGLCAAKEICKRKEFKNKNVVVIFPDGGTRYTSTPDFI